MAYNPYNAINNIFNSKGNWAKANAEKDKEKQKKVAEEAQKYYRELRENGYGDVADRLNAVDYVNAKPIRDYYAMTGRTETRPYLHSLGKNYGMSERDVDKLIGWNNTTGEVSFGGKVVGKPDANVDGTTYWSDTTALRNAFNDYIRRSGTATPSSMGYNQTIQEGRNRSRELWDGIRKNSDYINGEYGKLLDEADKDLTKTSAYKNTYKNIMGKYTLDALQGRENQLAGGGATNGGNIDSYAAANALRQQAAITAQGQMVAHEAGMNAAQTRIDNVKDVLKNMGYQMGEDYKSQDTNIRTNADIAQQQFNNEETKKQNQTYRDETVANVSGYVPLNMLKELPQYSGYFNEDGTIKDEIHNYNEFAKTLEKNGKFEEAEQVRSAGRSALLNSFGLVTKDVSEADKDRKNALEALDMEGNNAEKQINAETQGNIDIMRETDRLSNNENYALMLDDVANKGTSYQKAFIKGILVDYISDPNELVDDYALQRFLTENSKKYNLRKDTIKEICLALDMDASWLSDYKDNPDGNGIVFK